MMPVGRRGGGAGKVALVCLALALAGCGTQTTGGGTTPVTTQASTTGQAGAGADPGATTSAPPSEGGAPGTIAGLPRCQDVPSIRAKESLYRDKPQYGNAAELQHEVTVWAMGEPGYVQTWLDRERHGWITVGVKDADAAALQHEVEQRWPGEGIVVVEVPWTAEELEDLSFRVDEELRSAGAPTVGSSLSPSQGVVGLDLVATPAAEEVLAGFADEPLCVYLAEEPVADAPQPTAGAGWRLLAEAPVGEAYRTGVATTEDQLDQVWRSAGLEGAPAQVDWDSEVAVWFGAVYGSGCPVRLDAVAVTGDLLHPDLVVPGAGACPGDANPHAFVVAVERDVLPVGPFRVQLSTEDPGPGTWEERTVVEVDLSVPGSTATDEQIHLDEALSTPAQDPVVQDGDALTPDRQVRYVYRADVACATPVVGPLAGVVWRLADQEPPWDVEDGTELRLYLLDEQTLLVSSPQMDWSFVPLPAGRTCP